MKKEVENIMSLVSEYFEYMSHDEDSKYREYERQLTEAENELYSKGYGFKIKYVVDDQELEYTMIRKNNMMLIRGDELISESIYNIVDGKLERIYSERVDREYEYSGCEIAWAIADLEENCEEYEIEVVKLF